jgi:hypothetical protein
MVEFIYFLKPARCGTHFAGLRPEQGFQPVTRATADVAVLNCGVTTTKLTFNRRTLWPGLRVIEPLRAANDLFLAPPRAQRASAWRSD